MFAKHKKSLSWPSNLLKVVKGHNPNVSFAFGYSNCSLAIKYNYGPVKYFNSKNEFHALLKPN